MGNWFSSESTCESGTAASDAEYLESLENFVVAYNGDGTPSKQECDHFGGEYRNGISKTDPRTGIAHIGGGRCFMPSFNQEEFKMIQQRLCGRKINSNAFFCRRPDIGGPRRSD